MVDIIIPSIASVFLSVFAGTILKRREFLEQKRLNSILPKNKKQAFIWVGIIVSLVSIVVFSCSVYKTAWLNSTKNLLIIAFLWILTCIDYKSHIIPNKILVLMVICWIPFFAIELFTNKQDIKKIIISSLVACVGVALILCLMRAVSKGSIGFGDIKLFAVLGLFLEVQKILTVLFMSFIASFFVSVFLLISKRKEKKDQTAFAPFILVGTYISILFFGV